jgi:hypothetical protein
MSENSRSSFFKALANCPSSSTIASLIIVAKVLSFRR